MDMLSTTNLYYQQHNKKGKRGQLYAKTLEQQKLPTCKEKVIEYNQKVENKSNQQVKQKHLLLFTN